MTVALPTPILLAPLPATTPPATTPIDGDAESTVLRLARQFWYASRRWWWRTYWKLEVSGLENVPRRGAVLLCGNHTSHLDAAAILAALPRSFALRTRTAAAKDVFGDHPARDFLSRMTTGALPLQRGADFARGLRSLEAVLRRRLPLILFPEGRRSEGGDLVEFKPGAAMLSVRTGAPIVPLYIDGLRESLPRGAMLPKAGRVHVRFGRPIDPRPYRRAVTQGESGRRAAYDRLTADLRRAIEALGEGFSRSESRNGTGAGKCVLPQPCTHRRGRGEGHPAEPAAEPASQRQGTVRNVKWQTQRTLKRSGWPPSEAF